MFVRFLVTSLLLAVVLSVVARSSLGGGHEHRYRVRPYDTLWSIATSHYAGDPRAAVWRIERRNHLDGATISPGETLVLP
jgi:LysM domain-containing protein